MLQRDCGLDWGPVRSLFFFRLVCLFCSFIPAEVYFLPFLSSLLCLLLLLVTFPHCCLLIRSAPLCALIAIELSERRLLLSTRRSRTHSLTRSPRSLARPAHTPARFSHTRSSSNSSSSNHPPFAHLHVESIPCACATVRTAVRCTRAVRRRRRSRPAASAAGICAAGGRRSGHCSDTFESVRRCSQGKCSSS